MEKRTDLNEALPKAITDATAKLKPKKDAKKRKKWFNKRIGSNSLSLTLGTTDGEAGETVHYLLRGSLPAVTTSMTKGLLEAMHRSASETAGCRGQGNLAKGFQKMFHCGQYSSTAVRELAREIALGCSACSGSMPLPKKQHQESIYSWKFGERFQIDATEVAPDMLKRLRKSGYRYLLTLADCASKTG